MISPTSMSMNKRFIILLLFPLLLLSVPDSFALDFWQHPEMAEKYSIFAGGFAASFTYSLTQLGNFDFSLTTPEFYIDFMLPLGLPFSIGTSLMVLKEGYFGISARPGYHVNFNNPNLDLYVLYTLDLLFKEEEYALLEYSARLGFRYRLFSMVCVNIETGFAAKSVHFGLSIKLN